MAEINPPFAIDGTTSPAQRARRMMQAIMGPGVARTADLIVTQNGTPNMSVNVATGGAFVQGTTGTYQGVYFVENQGTVNKAIATAHATNPRRDIVVARVRENAVDGSGATAWDIHVVTGTPAASPVIPATPANCLLLAVVSVAAASSSIVAANITDARTLARPWGGSWEVAKTSPVTTPQTGITSTITDLTGLTVSFDAVAGRRYEATFIGHTYTTAANSRLEVLLRLGNNDVIRRAGRNTVVASSQEESEFSGRFEASGLVTVKASMRLGTGMSGTCALHAVTDTPAYLRVDDVGPA